MKIRVCIVPVLLAFVLARPVAAADVTCAQWRAYRTGDTSLQGQAPVFAAFLQGYIDAVNEYAGWLHRTLAHFQALPAEPSRPMASHSVFPPSNFVPPQMKFEDTASSMDRLCRVFDPTDSVVEIGVNDIKTEMVRRVAPMLDSMIEKLRAAPRLPPRQ